MNDAGRTLSLVLVAAVALSVLVGPALAATGSSGAVAQQETTTDDGMNSTETMGDDSMDDDSMGTETMSGDGMTTTMGDGSMDDSMGTETMSGDEMTTMGGDSMDGNESMEDGSMSGNDSEMMTTMGEESMGGEMTTDDMATETAMDDGEMTTEGEMDSETTMNSDETTMDSEETTMNDAETTAAGDAEGTSASGPGFTVALALVAVLGAALLLARRRS